MPARLLKASVEKLVAVGAELLICPDNTMQLGLEPIRAQAPVLKTRGRQMTKGRSEKLDVPFASDTEVIAMVAQFEACQWPYARWTHRAHLGVALCYLQQYPFAIALERMRHHIQLYNHICGDPSGYHETLTVLFMRRVERYLRDHPDAAALAAAVEELASLCDRQWPLRYYSPDCLFSEEARSRWVEPNRQPLDF